jgi:hypothetical protein
MFDPVSIIIQLVIALVLMAASYAITAMMTRKQAAKKPSAMEEFDFPQLDEGTAQAVVFGDVWTEDWMVLWYGDYKIAPIRSKGKKK